MHGVKICVTSLPNFNQCFDIHTDASDNKIDAVIIQLRKIFYFTIQKHTEPQIRYTATENNILLL